ncbi:MAG: flippase [Fusobacterium sp.]|uniref:flippase n=1 Tax=Fusobacterium sp. TaxID=68766 RepID=UPI002A762C40|nr:flippase [Fusobacterium sp.]MDY2980334.1 flippase [Fusobacterium sp.]
MKVKSVKLNFILNTTRIFLGAFFILVTTPYITRVLGAENLGKVDYVNSIIQYFILFTALGIPNYGIREIAKTRDNVFDRTKTIIELGIILIITTIIGYVVLFFLLNNINGFKELKTLILIMSTWILFNNIGFEWFYQGIENQVYITIRFIIIRLIVLILMFLFVKNSKDYIIYGIILVLMNSGSNVLNLINIRKYLSFKNITLKKLDLKKHIKPVLIIFAASLSVSIYLQLDVVMLGNVNEKIVAYYTVPNKLIRLVMILITALGTVLIPRISNCIKNNDMENYKKYVNYSLKYILMISIPSVVGIFLLADNIILIMAGEKFIESILTMRILVFILFIVGIAYFLGFQLLYPHGLEKYYTYSVTIAAIINFIFNYIMIPKYYQNGAAIGTIIAELTGVMLMLYFTRNYLKEIEFYNLKNLKYFISAIIMGIIILFIKSLCLGNILTMLVSISLGSIIYFIILLLLKEDIVVLGINTIKNKFIKG